MIFQPETIPTTEVKDMKKFKIVKKPTPTAPTDPDLSFRLIDFNVYDCVPETNTHSSASENSGGDDSSSVASADSTGTGGARGSGGGYTAATDVNEFRIQMFGINEQGETCSIFVDDYNPFFYIKVGPHWTNSTKSAFIRDIKKELKEPILRKQYSRGQMRNRGEAQALRV